MDAAERMLDLVIALSHTRHRMTKAEIRAKVNGYDDATSTEAFERMFERDKEALRQLGVPIITLVDAVHEDEVGYRIDVAAYELPAIELSPAKLESCHTSAAVLRGAAGEAAQAADAVELGTRRRDVEARVGLIREALGRGRRVHLRYVSASDQTTERDVDPLQLLTDSQHWFLVGWCHRAQDVRQFRVDRILGLEILDTAAEDHAHVELPDSADPDTAGATTVRLQLSSRARWMAEQLPGAQITELEEGWIAVVVKMVDAAWLDNVVLALGADVRAVEPAEVAAHLCGRAQAGLDAYAALGLLADR